MKVYIKEIAFPSFNQAKKYAKEIGWITEITIVYPNYLIDSYTTEQIVQLPDGRVVRTWRKIVEYITESRSFTYAI